MKLKNETVYNSDDLRALLSFLCAAHHCRKDKVIRIVYSRRGGGIGGWAHYGGKRKMRTGDAGNEAKMMCLALPGPSFPWPRPAAPGEHSRERATVEHLAQVFEHELVHNRGLSHREMAKDLLWCRQPVPLGTSNFEVRRELPAKAPSNVVPLEAARAARTVQAEQREARLRKALDKAEQKLKAQQRRVSKLHAKVNYYDRKSAAKAAMPRGEIKP